MTRCLALAAVIAGLIAPASAAAQLTAYDYGLRHVAPATHAGADVLLRAAFPVADAYWASLGRPLLCPVDLYLFDGRGVEARAPGRPSCIVWVERRYRNDAWELINNRHAPRLFRLDMLQAVCGTAAHERGRNLGLSGNYEIAGGIMRPRSALRVIPEPCVTWANQVLPRHGGALRL